MNDVLVVVRSIGELTEQLCCSIIVEQVGKDNIVIIHEKPFVEAVRKTFELGIASQKKWTLAIDADILIRKNAIKDLIEWAENQEDYFFEFQGRVVDKFFCGPRQGGPHLYRTKYFRKALEFLPKDKNALRPESFTYDKMAEVGFHYYHYNEIYGIHDYFQFYKDIYRKAFLHAHKHGKNVGYFIRQWAKYKEDDYRIALKGLIDGLSFNKKVEVNVDFFKEFIDKNLDGLIEKQFIANDARDNIDRIIESWKIDEDSVEFEKQLFKERRSDKRKLTSKFSLLYKIGNMFLRIGNKLIQFGK